MEPIRIPTRFRVMGKDHFIILPRELWSTDKRIEFRSSREAEQFFKSHVRDRSILGFMHSKLSRGSFSSAPRNEIELCEKLGFAVYTNNLYLVIPDEKAEKASMMPLASPRIRVKEIVQEVRKTEEALSLTNPRWEHTDEEKKRDHPKTVFIGDLIKLIADQKKADGKKIAFNISDLNMDRRQDPSLEVAKITSAVDSPTPAVEWKVSDSRNSKDPHRIINMIFSATIERYHTENCNIDVVVKEKGSVVIEINQESDMDDEFYTLEPYDKSFTETKRLSDGTYDGKSCCELFFDNLIVSNMDYRLFGRLTESSADFVVIDKVLGEKLIQEAQN